MSKRYEGKIDDYAIRRFGFLCAECGKLKMATTSGAVCPDGHGKITPGITETMIRQAAKVIARQEWLDGIEEIKRTPGGFCHDGVYWKPQKWMKDHAKELKVTVPSLAMANAGCVLFKTIGATGNVRVRQFVRCEKKVAKRDQLEEKLSEHDINFLI